MSAIAHWIEQHGITTVVIGLVRPHLEKILPPRSLWVPFELGRPVGAPTDQALQQRALVQALQLAETTTARRIVDFKEEDSRTRTDTAWRAPDTGNPANVSAECKALTPAYQGFTNSTGRTSVGVSGIPIEQCADLIDHVVRERVAAVSPRADVSDVLMLRLTIDDIKAYYTEAALHGAGSDNRPSPSSIQLGDWFWTSTRAGKQLQQLREELIPSEDVKLEGLLRRFIIPHRWRLSP